MIRRRMPARMAVLAVVLGLALPGGAAIAFWTASGGGSGTGATGTAQALVVAPAAPASSLRPGGQADVALTLSNPNPFPARVPSLQLDTAQGSGGFAVDGAHSGCGLGTLSFTTQTNSGAGWTVPARVGVTDGQLTVHLPAAAAMGVGAAAACQGAAFTVYVKVGP